MHSNDLNKDFFWAAIYAAPEGVMHTEAQDWFAVYCCFDGVK